METGFPGEGISGEDVAVTCAGSIATLKNARKLAITVDSLGITTSPLFPDFWAFFAA